MRNKIVPLSTVWEDVYHANLMQAFLVEGQELENHTFKLPPPRHNRDIENPARGFRVDFSNVMADWILGGKVEITPAMLALNPNAAKFATVLDDPYYGYHVTAYGPRIMEQIPHVLAELRRDPNSRRANIMMLASSDQRVAEAMARNETRCEYLCTNAFNFRLRDGKLTMFTSMRSNNYVTTVCQDIFVFNRLHAYVAEQLGVEQGEYHHHAFSGHILPGEVERAAEILRSYNTAYTSCHGPAIWTEGNGWLAAWRRFAELCHERGIA